jgi:hypothetical protein
VQDESNRAGPTAELVAHEEAHATVARRVGWTVTEIGYGPRGGSGFARYLAPSHDLGGWHELYVTLAGPIADARIYADDQDIAREVVIGQIVRKAKRIIGSGFEPKRDSDEWKAARILVAMHSRIGFTLDLGEIEQDLRESWAEVASILEGRES